LHAARRWIEAAESKISAAAIVVCVHVNLKVAVVDAAGDEGGGGGEDCDDDKTMMITMILLSCWYSHVGQLLAFMSLPNYLKPKRNQNSLTIAF
jgi:hypothetical protein